MNDKVNKNKKIKEFKNFKVTSSLMKCAKKMQFFFIVCLEEMKFQMMFFWKTI